jgi:hypothetical protein
VVHFSVSFHGAGALDGVARRRHRELRPRAEAVAGTGTGEFFKHRSAGGSTARFFTLDCHARLWTVTRANHAGFWQEALANLQNTIDEKVEESGLPDNLAALRDRALNTVDAARVTCRREIEAFQREQEEHFSRLDAEAAAAAADACVEINQRVGCTRQFFTKSFLGDDVAVLARSSGEEPASPRHRAGVASMAWRTTNAP